MNPRILLINPPIYDFSAYDFWLKPYGILSIAGFLRGKADFTLFDYLDRTHPFVAANEGLKSDQWGRGSFYKQRVSSPHCLKDIPRFFHRFGLPRESFINFLKASPQSDFVFVQTVMTYWYLGVKEVIEDIKDWWPNAKIILGGNYVTICPEHAKTLGASLIVNGIDISPLWQYLQLEPDLTQPPLWEAYPKLNTGVLKLTQGCPFSCTYCSVPKIYQEFLPLNLERSIAELKLIKRLGAQNIAFYDDALIFNPHQVFIPFLEEILRCNIKINLHTPNAINARFITKDLAEIMVKAGFKTVCLGFESASADWQKQTGAKIYSEEFAQAVGNLINAGADRLGITAYQILGHPQMNLQLLEESMHFVSSLGIRGMLSDFSPIPETKDGELCRKWVDLDEPLMHNKTAFPIIMLGNDEVNRLKELQRRLNRRILKQNRFDLICL